MSSNQNATTARHNTEKNANIPLPPGGGLAGAGKKRKAKSTTLAATLHARAAATSLISKTINRKHGRTTTGAVTLKVTSVCYMLPFRTRPARCIPMIFSSCSIWLEGETVGVYHSPCSTVALLRGTAVHVLLFACDLNLFLRDSFCGPLYQRTHNQDALKGPQPGRSHSS